MSKIQPVRFAYVGCGFLAQSVHIPNFAALPDCRFVALAEVREELGREVAERYRIPKVYRSHEQIAADPDIEAVAISAPYTIQGRVAEDLVRAGKHVFMEKPMAVSVARAEQIVAATRSPGAGRLMVAYMKRYDPGNLMLKRHLDAWRASGEAGRILLARNHGFGGDWVYAQDPNVPLAHSSAKAPPAPDETPSWLSPRWKGPYLEYLQQWTHNVNLLRFLLSAEGQVQVRSVQLDAKDGMTGIVILDVGGVRAVLESGYTHFHGWDEHTQIYFENGWLKTEAPALLQKETPATVEVYRAGRDGQPPRLTREFPPAAWSYREEAKHFLHCVRGGEPFRSSAEDTLYDVRVFEEIYRQFVGQNPE